MKKVQNYVGKMVFVEAVRDAAADLTKYSNYYGGEYFIVRQTPFSLHGIQIRDDDYNGREVRQLPLEGSGRYFVCSTAPADRAMMVAHLERLWWRATKPERGERLNCIESVYGELKSTARLLASVLKCKLDDCCTTPSSAVAPLAFSELANLQKRLKCLEDKYEAFVQRMQGAVKDPCEPVRR